MTKTGGKATFSGTNAQVWAALSLFLQYVRRSDLAHIAFEQEKLKDFDLVFSSGKKIVCESKARNITYSLLKEILDDLVDNNKVGKQDEILIICKKIQDTTKGEVENFRYYGDLLKEKFYKKGFTDKHLALFTKIKFWQVDEETNQIIVTHLFADILSIWVPEEDLSELISDILVKKVYQGSKAGDILTRSDFYKLLEDKKLQIQRDAGYVGKRDEKIAEVERIFTALQNPTNTRDWCNNQISLLTTNPDLYYLTVRKLEERANLKLVEWDNFWRASAKGTFSLQIFNIFIKNAIDPDNQFYLIKLLTDEFAKLIGLYRREFVTVDVAKICKAILNTSRIHDEQILEILKLLLTTNKQNDLFIEWQGREEWELTEISERLKDLYIVTNNHVKEKIKDFIFDFFNLVEDDGEYWHYTPNQIFDVIKLYVENDPEEKILLLAENLVKQYEEFYKAKSRSSYKGWELWGSGNSDRHFITLILQPIITDYYKKDCEAAWEFITTKLITRRESRVSTRRPDFLNRASMEAILLAYHDQKTKKEAFEILVDFVRMRNGIPHKTELIYHLVSSTSSLTDGEKWELVQLQLSYEPYGGLPANGHVERIVNDLANKGFEEAITVIDSWADNPEYNKYGGILESNVTSKVPGLVGNTETRDRGIAIFNKHIESDYFKNKLSMWQVWEVARVLTQILVIAPAQGKEMIQRLWSNKNLTLNQQVLITSGINGFSNEQHNNVLDLYSDVVSHWLTELEDRLDKIVTKIPDIQSRNSFIQFGEKLVKAGNYEAGVRFAKIFIDDTNPSIENDPDDPEGKQNYHELVKKGKDVNQITSVRVWVAWLLQGVATLKGRDYIPQILPLVEKLTNDNNYYVRAYACMPLEQLARNRHTVLPNDKTQRFLSPEVAEKIEHTCYSMLRNEENWKIEQVMMGLVRVFSYFRSISEEDAKEILKIILNTKNDKVIESARVLFLFFAEFRKKSVNSENLKYVFSEQKIEELKQFDDKYFKVLLEHILIESSSEVRAGFAWQFWQLPSEQGGDFDAFFAISYHYLLIITQGSYDHNVIHDIYYFIDEYLSKRYAECIDLWKKCLLIERPYLANRITKDNLYEMHWWPHHNNGTVLAEVGQREGAQEFLKWLEYLLDYPVGVMIANDLPIAIDYLMTIPYSDHVNDIFRKLASRYVEYVEKLNTWLVKKDH